MMIVVITRLMMVVMVKMVVMVIIPDKGRKVVEALFLLNKKL